MDLAALVHTTYPQIKSQNPGLGRRAIKLQILDIFWASDQSTLKDVKNIDGLDSLTKEEQPDPHDLSEDQEALGILVRTDYSDDSSWSRFLESFQQAEKSFLEDLKSSSSSSDVEKDDEMDVDSHENDDGDEDSESSTTSEEELSSHKIIHIFSSSPELTNLSNIALLRLLCDPSLQRAPTKPPTSKAIASHRLTHHRPSGLREIYAGPNIWVYDSKSNIDGCVRAVSSEGPNQYGCAAGDSWRAKGSHIHELQWNMTVLGLTIDFGGLDRWDLDERNRNLREAL